MKALILAALALAACSTADASPGPAEYRRVNCGPYSPATTVYSGIDRRVLERSVIVVMHDTSTNPEVTTVGLPSFVAVSGGIQAYVSCYGVVDFVREQ